jgi:hypothetical protein
MSEQFEKNLKRLEVLRECLELEGYVNLTVIEGRGICGLQKFMYTMGLCFGLDELSFNGRYCFPHAVALDAFYAITVWDGKEDPPGRWVKYKGKDGEYWNPKETENEYR